MKPSECLQEAVGMIDERFVAELAQACPLGAAPRRPWVRWVTAAAACLTLAIGVGTAMRLLPMMAPKSDMEMTVQISSAIDPDAVVWLDPSRSIGTFNGQQTETETDAPAMDDNGGDDNGESGWWMSDTLTEALAEAENGNKRLAILVSPILRGKAFRAFLYQGRTYSEWEAYASACFDEMGRRQRLLKLGDALKYGEALYTTGTPEGERWSKELYEKTVSELGEDFLARYIVNGELKKDLLEQEIEQYDAEYRRVYEIYGELADAFREELAQMNAEQLIGQGIPCEVIRGRLFMFVTAWELAQIRHIDRADVMLSLASRRMYDEAYDLFLTLNTSVSGFNTDILSIETDYMRSRVMDDDADVIAALRFLYDHYQHDSGYLEVHVSCTRADALTDAYFADYGWEVAYRSRYSDVIYLRVPFDRFDLQLLCDLSNRADVTYIYIGMPDVQIAESDDAE